VSTTEELLGRKSGGSSLEIRDYGRRGLRPRSFVVFLFVDKEISRQHGLAGPCMNVIQDLGIAH
jgi:hypothetical protein